MKRLDDPEKLLLGTMLLSAKACRAIASRAKPEWFYVPAHAILFETIRALFEMGQPVDIVILKHALEKAGQLQQCGGAAYVVQVCESVVSCANWKYHLDQVREAYNRRELRKRLGTLAKRLDANEDYGQIVAEVQSLTRGVVDDAINTIEIDQINLDDEGDLSGIPTGFPAVDHACVANGFTASEVSYIMAGTGVGKTSLMVTSMLSAITEGRNIAYATYEMDGKSIVRRLIKQITGSGRRPADLFTVDEWEQKLKWIQYADLVFFDPSMTDADDFYVEDLLAWAIERHSRFPLDIMFVDYAQLLITRQPTRDQFMVMQTVSRKLKKLAKRLAIPIVVGSQVTVANGEIRARMSREFENDSGLLLHVARDPDSSIGSLTIKKNRHGKGGITIPIEWSDKYARFSESVRDREAAA